MRKRILRYRRVRRDHVILEEARESFPSNRISDEDFIVDEMAIGNAGEK